MRRRVLLVEGKDDQHVMRNLFEARSVPDSFVVETPGSSGHEDPSGGVEKLLASIPTWLQTSDLERFAIVVDANSDASARWDAIRNRLIQAGIDNVPRGLKAEGTVFDALLPPEPRRPLRLGVWIMPDNGADGMIEDFVAEMISENDDMLPEVDRFLDSIPRDQRRFERIREDQSGVKSTRRPKARIHSWLAVQEEPGKPMGQAITAKYLDVNHGLADRFVTWINEVLLADGPRP